MRTFHQEGDTASSDVGPSWTQRSLDLEIGPGNFSGRSRDGSDEQDKIKSRRREFGCICVTNHVILSFKSKFGKFLVEILA